MAAEGEDFLPRLGVPEPDGPVLARGRQPAAVGAEGDAEHRAHVALKHRERLERLHVPDDHRRIPARRGEPPSVGAEREMGNQPLVAAEHAFGAARRCVQEGDGADVIGGGEGLAVGAEGEVADDARLDPHDPPEDLAGLADRRAITRPLALVSEARCSPLTEAGLGLSGHGQRSGRRG